ncbi:helix-turn-helix domain-containing protein [Microbacterium rhizophilus]|uniref:helix-turn-helix domain-containing protein n=1 Tax=Microbacterium rhizophilus TaxID=3138934 RepID=UPI0031ED3747
MPRVASPAAAHIGGHIRRIRDGLEMTHDELAAETSIDSSNIRAYEAGRQLPSLHNLIRICEALRAAPGDVLEGVSSEMFPTPAVDRRTRAHRRNSGAGTAA